MINPNRESNEAVCLKDNVQLLKQLKRSSSERPPDWKRGSLDSVKSESATKSISRLSTRSIGQRDSLNVYGSENRSRPHSSCQLARRPANRVANFEGRMLERRASFGRMPTSINSNRTPLCRNGSSPAPSSSHQRSLKNNRSTSVVSNYSTSSTYEARVHDSDVSSPTETEELKKRLQDRAAEADEMQVELRQQKEEISKLRDKVTSLTRELTEVCTTKGALNEACVGKMMDVLSLNAQIAELEEAKSQTEKQNQQLRHDAASYDAERRGLLDFLDDCKLQLRDYEKALDLERTRNNELEASLAANMDQLGMELKFIRRELQEKNLRLKKLARANTKLACKLLAVEADSAEANDLAKVLQSKNTELEGDNRELVSFVLQLETQIDQMATERTLDAASADTKYQQLTRFEEERARMLNLILSVESEIEQTRKDVTEDKEKKLELLREEKAELQNNVTALTNDIRALKKRQTFEREEEARMKMEYVQRLEEDLQAAQAHIEELNKTLKGARDSETETMSSNMKASEEITKLESEKAVLQQNFSAMELRLKSSEEKLQKSVTEMAEEKNREIQDLQSEVNNYKKKVESLDKRTSESQKLKLEAEASVRKLEQDISNHTQEKENLEHQVNVLEWQLVSLYSDKEDAIRSLAHKDMEVTRLQQEIAGKEDDLNLLRKEFGAEKDAQLELYELQFSRDQVEYALNEAQRRVKALEHELDQVKKDKSTNNDISKDSKKPRIGFKLRFDF
eukprot:g2029.t1